MKHNRSLIRNSGFQTFATSILCIILGLIVGYLALLIIHAEGAGEAIGDVMKNFFTRPDSASRMKYFGSTLAKTAPLIFCSLSVLFAYKVGLFNIGAAGQYCLGMGVALRLALESAINPEVKISWVVCLLCGVLAGGISGAICGLLKAFCNVNVVISGIMLNWISLYGTNMLLKPVMNPTGKDTFRLVSKAKQALLPTLGMDKLFNNQYVTIAIPCAVLVAVVIWILLEKTKLGYELKATGNNPNAAKYCGMKENRNIILTMVIAGGLAAMGGAMYYLSDFEQWNVNSSSVPAMGFNGIAAAFLGGLNPIGSIFSSYFITHITMGGGNVNLSHYCPQIADLISAVIIYLCGFVLFFKTMVNNSLRKSDERRIMRQRAAEEAANQEGGNS
ncbi:MAG: ABC transporter permease [Oscillospiraceae bacterium]|nr:ABC transporter permease [Oscillospiraceae bacterium]